ncbi:MAG: 3-isopropylmalate dehydrogenase, partial [Nitrospinae bacterium]|nr:3-isopropylmalate dehydrogenase [Nitrospinota bacterium]
MTKKIAVFAGDGIGPEVMDEALRVLLRVNDKYSLGMEIEKGLVG